MGKKRKKSSSSSEVENCCGEVASDVRIIHADTYTICHTCILYTTRARIDTHTHTYCFSYGELGVNTFLAIHDLHFCMPWAVRTLGSLGEEAKEGFRTKA